MGKPRARIRVCEDPVLGGVREALKSSRISEVMQRHRGMAQIFVLCVDRDGEEGRRRRLDEIEAEFGCTDRFLAEEQLGKNLKPGFLRVWTLPANWCWADVRADVHVKENYFDRLANERRIADGPGGGRKRLGEEAASHISRIRLKCPEDFDCLYRRLEAATQSR